MKRRLLFSLVCLALGLMLGGCTRPGPTMETGPDAEISHDGLHRIDRSRRLQRVWVKPGLSLKGYTKILPVNAGVHFKRPPRKSRGEWPLNDEQMEFVRDGLREAVQKELEKQGQWEFVTERGPDVLVVRGAILDLVVTAPSNEVGRNTSFSRSIGQATLLIELFDSESLEILARIADRRAINHGEGSWRNDPTSNRAAARQTFRDWARRLSKALDYARTVGLPDLETPDEQEPQGGEPSSGPVPDSDSGEAAK